MFDYDKFFSQYEGKYISHRGRCDDINWMVRILSVNLPKHSSNIDRSLISEFMNNEYVHDIKIDGDNCNIKFDDGEVSFSLIPESIKSKFGFCFYDIITKKYYFLQKCHSVTLKYLKLNHNNSNIYAITSLCLSMNNVLFFHSYIWDKESNKIIDFSRNIIMDKNEYDYLFCYREINCLNYNEFSSFNSDVKNFSNIKGYYRLLYYALITLFRNDLKFDNSEYRKKSKILARKN